MFNKFSRLDTSFVLIFGTIIVVFLHLPFLILGESTYLNIHDNLDSDFIYLHLLKISNNLFSWDANAVVKNVFDGLPRNYFHSEYSFIRVLFYFLPSFWAYTVNSILVRTIGFIGICLLARDYFSVQEFKDRCLVLLLATVMVLLPIFTIYGASILGQPLVLWAFLNLLYNQKHKTSFLIIGLYPFYCHFTVVGLFIIAAFFLASFIRLVLFKRPLSWAFCLGGGLLCAMFVITNHSLFSLFLFSTTPLHREEIVLPIYSLSEIVDAIRLQLFFGLGHSCTITTWPLILLAVYAAFNYKEARKLLLYLLMLPLLIVVFDNLYRPFVNAYLSDISLFTKVQLNRFGMLLPSCWILLTLLLIQSKTIKHLWVALVIVLLIPFARLPIFEIGVNWIRLLTNIEYIEQKYPSFNAFYSPRLFKDIEKHIHQPKDTYRVVSLGMHPSIALYNGFYTLDGYQNMYPLSYKKKFRTFIAGELDKNETLRKYFDEWGHRCYLFADTLKKTCYLDCNKKTGLGSVGVDFNIEMLKKSNVHYIFSTVELHNQTTPIMLDTTFENSQSRWKIYLYKL